MLDQLSRKHNAAGMSDAAAAVADTLFEPCNAAWLGRSPLERFEYVCRVFPEKIAIADAECKLTYRELRRVQPIWRSGSAALLRPVGRLLFICLTGRSFRLLP